MIPVMSAKILVAIGAYAVGQASAIAALVVAVVNSGLSPFAQALIIAIVTALIGVLGAIVAALITSAATRRTDERLGRIEQHQAELKGAVGADRREGDTIEDQ